MYILTSKNSQIQPQITATLYQNTYYVDQSVVDGLSLATFCSVQSGKSDCLQEGHREQATLMYAGKDVNRKASGFIYDTSAKDQYGRKDDFENEYNLYPYGPRQSRAIALIKKGVIEISDIDNKFNIRVYRTVDEKIADTVAISDKHSFTLKNSKLQYGDKLELVSNEDNKKEIVHIVSVEEDKITFTPDTDIANTKTIIAKCQIDDPVYLNNTPKVKNGKYESRADFPFTPIRANVGELDQLVGYIESPKHIRVDLTKDICPIKRV